MWIATSNNLIDDMLLLQDSFYRGLTNDELKRVHEYNFDHPSTVAWNLIEIVE